MSTIENAEITETLLGYADHGILTFSIGLKGKGWGVNYGNRALDGFDKKEDKRTPDQAAMRIIPEILNVVGVRKWEELKGKYVRVETNGLGRTITKIGNLIDDVWLDLDDFLNT